MKIIQINGWLGRLNAPLARFISEQQADFVCLQEVFAPKTSGMEVFIDQYTFTDELIQQGNFTHNFFVSAWGFEMGGETIDVGNIILSKYPLSQQISFHTHGKYHIKSTTHAIRNTRVWQTCQAALPNGKTLTVSNYQGYLTGASPLGDEVTIQTLEKVREALARLPQPLIFCGDLNITPQSKPIRVLDQLGLTNLTKDYKVQTTLSAAHRAPENDRNSVPCDYIFVSKDVQVNDFRVSEELISDHKALILEFNI